MGADSLTLRIDGTRAGVTEALRRLDLTVRTTESVVDASPTLATALRMSRNALARRLEVEFRVKIFIGLMGSGSGSGVGGAGVESQTGWGEDEESVPAALATAAVAVTGLPEDVKATIVWLRDLVCVEEVVTVEHKALSTLIGPGGAHLRQLEVRWYRLAGWLAACLL